MPRSYTKLLYHIVFSTKKRRPQIVERVRPRLHEYLGGAIRDEGGVALIVNGVADHVHILARLRQDKALSAVIGAIKSNSSGWVHRTFRGCQDYDWQDGYSAFTVSVSQVERVRLYIATQEEHHKVTSYQKELLTLLRKHDIEFDERYLWND